MITERKNITYTVSKIYEFIVTYLSVTSLFSNEIHKSDKIVNRRLFILPSVMILVLCAASILFSQENYCSGLQFVTGVVIKNQSMISVL